MNADLLQSANRLLNAKWRNLQECRLLQKRLMSFGPEAATTLLDTIHAERAWLTETWSADTKIPVVYCLEVVRQTAESVHAEMLLDLLDWDEIIKDEDRSIKSLIVDTIGRVGDATSVPRLKAFYASIKYLDYGTSAEPHVIPFLRRWDKIEVEAAILACANRTLSPKPA